MAPIKYISTRGNSPDCFFSEAVLNGTAQDNGLYVPTSIPKITSGLLTKLINAPYSERAYRIIRLFKPDISDTKLRQMTKAAYGENFDHPEIAPLTHLGNNRWLLELYHGPTSAFKDMALQLMPKFYAQAVQNDNQKRENKGQNPLRYVILVATSGDTGKAALEGYKRKSDEEKTCVGIVVFYPKGRVSTLQEMQMVTQEGNNVAVVAMEGNFDDAQRSVKETFADQDFRKKLLSENCTVLSSANSINWGRLLPQIVYHISAYVDLLKQNEINKGDQIDIVVPTGNFGNILSAFYAKEMGLPIRKLICASNENNVLTEFLQTGIYDLSKRSLKKTPSPSMDILIASNVERLLFLLTKNPKQVKKWMDDLKKHKKFEVDPKTKKTFLKLFFADFVSNSDCLAHIRKVFESTGYLIDTHTSVADKVAERYAKKEKTSIPLIVCSTAHWAKFPREVYEAITKEDQRHNEFEIIKKIEKHTKAKAPRNIAGLKGKKCRFQANCLPTKDGVEQAVIKFLQNTEI